MPRCPVVIPPADGLGPVALLSPSGQRLEFSSLASLSQWLASRVSCRRAAYGRWDLSIGPEFRVRIDCNWLGQPYYREYDWVLVDRTNRRLDPKLIVPPAWSAAWRARNAAPSHNWRQDPVPYTRGSRRRRQSDFMRYPKTQSARRAGQAPVDDHEPCVRGSRNSHHLPTAWDDQARCNQRSWKSHRRTQWKPVQNPTV